MLKFISQLLFSVCLFAIYANATAESSSGKKVDLSSSYSYVGLRAGRAILDSDDIDARLDGGTTHTHDGYYSHTHDDIDDTAFFSVFYGKKFKNRPLRLELEYANINGLDYVSSNSLDLEAESQRLMLNLYYDHEAGRNFYINAGVGIGAADNDISGTSISSDNGTQFAYSVGIGATYVIRPKINLEFGYRYVNLGDLDYTNSSSIKTNDDLESQEGFIGVRYLF